MDKTFMTQCLLDSPEGQFKRPPPGELQPFPYPPSVTEAFMDEICALQKKMSQAGYKGGLPLAKYADSLRKKFVGTESNPMPAVKC